MAQYQKNFYGTSYYGNTNAFSGTYETSDILTEETLKATCTTSLTAVLPDATYGYTSTEIVRTNGNWRVNGTSTAIYDDTPSAKLTFTATCDRVIINYIGRPDGTDVTVKVTTTEPGTASVITNYTFSSVSVSITNKQYVIDELAYGNQVVEISLGSDNAANKTLQLRSIQARVCAFTLEIQAKTGSGGTYTSYVKIPLTKTAISGRTDAYTLTATSPNYAGKDHVKIRLWLASSDNDKSPIVEELDVYAGDTSNRTEDGSWTGTINMIDVATPTGTTFKETVSIDWTSTVPTGTNLTIRSRSAATTSSTVYSAMSAPYKKSTHRLRIKEGFNEGYIITSLINPASVNPNLRIDHWESWDDTSYMPLDESSVRILYEFLDEQDNVLLSLDQPKYISDRSLIGRRVANKPYRIKISLSKRVDKATPVVDSIQLTSNLIYEERKSIDKYKFSAVDNLNTGEQMILDMSTLSFTAPAEATTPLYYLEDRTERPRDIVLYLESTNNLPPSISRPNYTSSRNDRIWARINVDTTPKDATTTGVFKHFQYGGGSVVINQGDEMELLPSFTPSLDDTKEYRYFLMSGWYNPETGAPNNGTVNNNVIMYWSSEQINTPKTNVTEISAHNKIINGNPNTFSDKVIVLVSIDSTWGLVDWVSEEKIYSGTVNLNDLRGDYIRTHVTPESGDSVEMKYVTKNGDTYESIAALFQVDEYDLRSANGDLTTPVAIGKTIIIPARIILPRIDPAAIVSAQPYQIDVIYNSVKQKDIIVPDNRVFVRTLKILEEEVVITKEKIIRGSLENGKDLLNNAKVIEVIGIWDSATDVVQASNYISGVDYDLSGNYISWSYAEGMSREPDSGEAYYVSYKCLKPKQVTITIGCDYQEESGVDRIWRSPDVKAFTGTCSPGVDFRAALPSMSEWEGAEDEEIKNKEYIIEDNDLWVKTWIDYDSGIGYANGSLQDRVPKDNWFPTIQTGFYYLGSEEYYLFSEPITVAPTESEMARSGNIEYVPGKYSNAAKFQPAAENLVRNSGFDVKKTSTVQKFTF
jgi:LysM repeat protein